MNYNDFLGKFLNEHKDGFVEENRPNLKTIDISEVTDPVVKSDTVKDLRDVTFILGFRKLNRLLSIMSRIIK